MDFKIVENVLPETVFKELEKALDGAFFKSYDVGGNQLYYHEIPNGVAKLLSDVCSREVGKELSTILSFARLNTPELNTEFRVHADSVIFNQKPTIASVFYLKDSIDSGTALFEHPVYGKKHVAGKNPQIILEDDGKWHAYKKYYAKANTMFIYNSDLYHGRFPWKVNEERIVLVNFMR
jgi:hypothetical protein